MKTFRDLKIGDKVFTVATQANVVREVSDGYVVNSGEIADKKDIRSMEIEKEYLCINRYRGYNGTNYDFKVPVTELDSFSFTEKGIIIFVDEKLAHQFIRQRVLEAIKVEEKRIPDTVKSVEDNIKSIRQRYYHVLNNVEHDVFANTKEESK